jgi:hypothetical protein
MKLAHLSVLLFGVVLLNLWACGNSDKLAEENHALKIKATTDSLYIISLSEEMDIVYQSLDSVKLLADSLLHTSDLLKNKQLDKKDANKFINKTMSDIDKIMAQNRQNIINIETKLSKANSQKAILQRMVDRLQKDMEEKEEIIAKLRRQIIELEKSVEGLKIEKQFIQGQLVQKEAELQQKQQEIAQTATEMQAKINKVTEMFKEASRGYYLVGTKKELVAKGFLKTRGLLNKIDGLGDGLEDDKMHPLDLSIQNLNIDIGGDNLKTKNIVLVPARQDNTFIISQENGRTYLHIIHKDFWKKSKYLLVVTN